MNIYPRILCAAAGVALCTSGFCARLELSKAGYWEVPDSPRVVRPFNTGWTFSLDGFETERRVSLPHCIDEGELPENPSGGVNRRQKAWYRKRFGYSRSAPHVFLHFEAVMGKCAVSVNGRELARHFGGFLPVHVEVTDALVEGENVVEVWCDNSDDPSFPPGKGQDVLDYTYFGGIYRDVWLVETGESYVADSGDGGVYVTTSLGTDGRWTVRADVTLGGMPAESRLFFDGEPVESVFSPENPSVWTPETPSLHTLRVEAVRGGRVTDAVGVRFGIRDFSFGPDGMTLNGKLRREKLIGVNRHQDYLYLGFALSNSLHWRDAKKYRDAGFTVIRNAHYPQDPAFMDACDALGLFVIVNTPGWQFWNGSDPLFEKRVYDDIRRMVRRDRSRPSVLLWEPILNETHFPESFAAKARETVESETRAPNYCACDSVSPGHGGYPVNFGNAKEAGKPSFCREWGDFVDDWNAQNSRSRVRAEWGEGPMLAQAAHYMDEPGRPCLAAQLAMPPWHFGGTLWHGADHARGYHPDNFYGGVLTYGRRPKYSYWAFKAALSREPFVFLAHALAPYSPEEFTVFSNCAYSATWLGRPFVPGETKFRYSEEQNHTRRIKPIEDDRFVVTLPDGSSFTRRRALRFARIGLSIDTDGVEPVADGSDLVSCIATLEDAEGTPRRYTEEMVRFAVEGPAEIIGENPQRTRWGEAQIVLRMGDRPGPVRVTCETVRRGPHVRQRGELVFTPLAADGAGNADGCPPVEPAAVGEAADDSPDLSEVERQQSEFESSAPQANAPSERHVYSCSYRAGILPIPAGKASLACVPSNGCHSVRIALEPSAAVESVHHFKVEIDALLDSEWRPLSFEKRSEEGDRKYHERIVYHRRTDGSCEVKLRKKYRDGHEDSRAAECSGEVCDLAALLFLPRRLAAAAVKPGAKTEVAVASGVKVAEGALECVGREEIRGRDADVFSVPLGDGKSAMFAFARDGARIPLRFEIPLSTGRIVAERADD